MRLKADLVDYGNIMRVMLLGDRLLNGGRASSSAFNHEVHHLGRFDREELVRKINELQAHYEKTNQEALARFRQEPST